MTIPRRLIVDRDSSGIYHCISRCVRRAHLCGDEYEHRKVWVHERLQDLALVFAIDVGGFAVLSNHLHVVVRTDPERARRWSGREVARRWLRLFPRPIDGDEADDRRPSEADVRRLAADVKRIGVLRRRLSDLSWFMRCLKEPIARRANKEDGCTGRFWEGRFKCQVLLDDAAILACLVYVDLNVIRAALARTPEESDHTSVQERIKARQFARRSQRRSPATGLSRGTRRLFANLAAGRRPSHAEHGIWLAPIETPKSGGGRRGLLGISLDEYLSIVDATGRMIAAGKPGAIRAELEPILTRLGVDSDRWQAEMSRAARMFGTAIGSAARLAEEACRRGCRWVVGALDVHCRA